MPAAPSPTRSRAAGRRGRWSCCVGRGTTAATALSRPADWPSAGGRRGSRSSGRWQGVVEPLDLAALDAAALVVDGIFGAGLARPVDGIARAVIEAINERQLP